jgi:Cu+-exporting ATPase
VLIRSAEVLENAHKLDVLILDKTGTITQGKPKLTDTLPANLDDVTFALIAAAEAPSEHPLAQAIVESAKSRHLTLPPAQHFEALTGRGIAALVDGHQVLVGNQELLQEYDIKHLPQKSEPDQRDPVRHTENSDLADALTTLSSAGKSTVLAAIDGNFSAAIAVADTVKADSAQAIHTLRSQGIDVWMASGDNTVTAEAIAAQVGITHVVAQVSPGDKADIIARLQSEGKLVGMIGDGINDAPALTQADVGFAIGTGTDVAIESSDITLMSGKLSGAVNAIALSKATMRNIKENLWFAFGYNGLGIPVAAGALYAVFGLLLNPMIAGAAMAFSSLSVVINANRLRRLRLGESFGSTNPDVPEGAMGSITSTTTPSAQSPQQQVTIPTSAIQSHEGNRHDQPATEGNTMSLFHRHQHSAGQETSDSLTATDPVCGMTVQRSHAAATRELDGKHYYFCSTHCADTFDKNPAAYLA